MWGLHQVRKVAGSFPLLASVAEVSLAVRCSTDCSTPFLEISNRGHFSDSERFISTCNDLQEHGRHPKSLQDTLAHRYCVPRRVLWLLAVFVSVEELVDEWDSNP